jgi:hypothetical protein
MKAKNKVAEIPVVSQEKKILKVHPKALSLRALGLIVRQPLPDPPLIPEDVPMIGPDITQKEIVAFLSARSVYRVARADYEAKRGKIVLKLLQFCTPERGSHTMLHLDEGGVLHVREHHSRPPICFDEQVY